MAKNHFRPIADGRNTKVPMSTRGTWTPACRFPRRADIGHKLPGTRPFAEERHEETSSCGGGAWRAVRASALRSSRRRRLLASRGTARGRRPHDPRIQAGDGRPDDHVDPAAPSQALLRRRGQELEARGVPVAGIAPGARPHRADHSDLPQDRRRRCRRIDLHREGRRQSKRRSRPPIRRSSRPPMPR